MEIAHWIMLSLVAFWPVVLAKLLVRGSWRQIFGAYGMYWGGLTLIGLGMGNDEAGWMLLIALFTTVFMVPLIVVFLKIFKASNEKHEKRTVTTTVNS